MRIRSLHCIFRVALVFTLLFSLNAAKAAYLSRPELVDYNFAGASVCEKSPLKIKFDHEFFNAGNVFTVEIAVNGSFTGNNIISMVGTLNQSGNQQNVFLTVAFPTNVPAGSNYRLRVKGSNPLTYSSQLNEFPFTVSKLPPSDPSFYPQNYWRGYFYTWTPSVPTTIPDASAEVIFNPARYIGYISEANPSFDFNWGNSIPAPASFADTNKVCGTGRDFFAIRMRRRFTFDAGYYKFSGGADDGFRFSIDGGQTWILSDWGDHQFREISYNGQSSCGLYLEAGPRDLVVEYYENKTDARFKFSMEKTPSAADFVGLNSSYCINSPSTQLFSLNPDLAGVFSGPGINANVFSPQLAGPGNHSIMYFLLGSSGACSDTVRKTVSVNNLPDAGFSGLPGSVCAGSQPISLQPNTEGGVFTGSGIVNGNQFSPAGSEAGNVTTITYSITLNNCSNQSSQGVFVQAAPDPGFSGLPDTVGSDGGRIDLLPIQTGGVFSGMGIDGNAFYCDRVPAPASHEVTYTISINDCILSSKKQVYVYPVNFQIPNLLTVNGDGANEEWILSGIPKGSNLKLFNRWGKLLVEKPISGSTAWKPTEDLGTGNYYYLIETSDGKKRWSGWLQLSRKD